MLIFRINKNWKPTKIHQTSTCPNLSKGKKQQNIKIMWEMVQSLKKGTEPS